MGNLTPLTPPCRNGKEPVEINKGQVEEEIIQEAYFCIGRTPEKAFNYSNPWKVLSSSPKWKGFEAIVILGGESRKEQNQA